MDDEVKFPTLGPEAESRTPEAEGEAAPFGVKAEPTGVVAASDGVGAEGRNESSVEATVESKPSGAKGPEGKPADGRRWYVVHTYSGYEHKVKRNLEHRIQSMDMQNKIFQVIVPTEEEIELKDGQRRTIARRIFPGYVFVEMIMSDDSWYVVRNTPGVTGFVGVGNKPSPLPDEEVDKIMKRIESEEPKLKVSFKPGQKVRITSGIFAEFMGIVDEVYPEKGKARVLVSFFNRETPVEVDFLQLEKA
jgi:transcriptional antiterminator NusG